MLIGRPGSIAELVQQVQAFPRVKAVGVGHRFAPVRSARTKLKENCDLSMYYACLQSDISITGLLYGFSHLMTYSPTASLHLHLCRLSERMMLPYIELASVTFAMRGSVASAQSSNY